MDGNRNTMINTFDYTPIEEKEQVSFFSENHNPNNKKEALIGSEKRRRPVKKDSFHGKERVF